MNIWAVGRGRVTRFPFGPLKVFVYISHWAARVNSQTRLHFESDYRSWCLTRALLDVYVKLECDATIFDIFFDWVAPAEIFLHGCYWDPVWFPGATWAAACLAAGLRTCCNWPCNNSQVVSTWWLLSNQGVTCVCICGGGGGVPLRDRPIRSVTLGILEHKPHYSDNRLLQYLSNFYRQHQPH